jgi:hypothetical protein
MGLNNELKLCENILTYLKFPLTHTTSLSADKTIEEALLFTLVNKEVNELWKHNG